MDEPINERRRFLIKIMMINRNLFREYFGLEFANQCGHFVDRYMSAMIHSFSDWVDYPKGDRLLSEHFFQASSAVISSDGCLLYVGLADGSLVLFDLLKNEVIREWKAHLRGVWSLAHHSFGLLCSGSANGTISLWNSFDDFKLIHRLIGHCDNVLSVKFNSKGTQILSGSSDQRIRLWSVKTGECLRELEGHTQSVYSALFIDDLIISGSTDKSIRVWHSDHTECIRVIQDVPKPINQVCINSDSTLIAATFHFGFTIFKWPGMEIILTLKKRAHYGQFHPIHPHLLAVGDRSDYSVRIYDVMSEECVQILEGHSQNVRDLRLSPDGFRLVSVSKDKTTRVWDLSGLRL